jgi:hypothetical protein
MPRTISSKKRSGDNGTHIFMMTWVLPIAAILWIALWFIDNRLARYLVGESGLIENLQFVLLFLSCILFAFAAYKISICTRRNHLILYRNIAIAFAILAFVLAMEEISWGQRVIGLETPEFWQALNAQNEINLHNLAFVQKQRFWFVIVAGVIGISSTFVTYSLFSPLRPKSYLVPAFALMVASGILRFISMEMFWVIDIERARKFSYFADRFMEIGELAFALAVFSYALFMFEYWGRTAVRDGIG